MSIIPDDHPEDNPETEFHAEHDAAEERTRHRRSDVHDPSANFDLSHGYVPSTDFDFDAVDEALGVVHAAPPDARAQAADVLQQLMAWCFRGNQPLRVALVKFTAITAGLRPDLLGDRTLEQLALECGVTKQALSKQGVRFSDAFGIQFARGRLPEARERMAEARRGKPGHNPGQPHVLPSPTIP